MPVRLASRKSSGSNAPLSWRSAPLAARICASAWRTIVACASAMRCASSSPTGAPSMRWSVIESVLSGLVSRRSAPRAGRNAAAEARSAETAIGSASLTAIRSLPDMTLSGLPVVAVHVVASGQANFGEPDLPTKTTAAKTLSLGGRSARRQDGHHLEIELLGEPENRDFGRNAHLLLGELELEGIDSADGLAVECDDPIPQTNTRLLSRAALFEGDYQNPALHGKLVKAGDAAGHRHGLAAHADVATRHLPVADETDRDELRGVDSDGEADSLRGQNDGGIDPDHFSARVHERAPGVARVQRRIGLDDVVDETARLGSERPAQGADNARGHGGLEAVRIADRDRDLTHTHRSRVAERGRREGIGADANDREVGLGIVADEGSLAHLSVITGHGDRIGAVDDVAVREDESIRSEEETGRAAAEPARVAGLTPVPTLGRRAPCLDVHDRGADAVHRVDDRLRVSIQQKCVIPDCHGTLDSTTSLRILASILRLRYSLPAFPPHSRLTEDTCRTRHRATAGSRRRTVPGSSRGPGAMSPKPPPLRSSTASGTIRAGGSGLAARSRA